MACAENYGRSKIEEHVPMSYEIVFQYSTALKYLLRVEHHNVTIGKKTYVFWFSPRQVEVEFGETEETFVPPTDIKNFFCALKRGAVADGLRGNEDFNILCLEHNSARKIITLCTKISMAQLEANLRRYHEDMDMGEGWRCPSIFGLMRHIVPVGKSDDLLRHNHLINSLLMAIINGTKYPPITDKLTTMCVRQIQEDGWIDECKIALWKAILSRNFNVGVPTMLDRSRTDIAYLLGRYLACADRLQYAKYQPNRSISQCMIESILYRPSAYYPVLAKKVTVMGHMNELSEIAAMIDATKIPTRFTRQEQGVFFSGFASQKEAFKKEKEKNQAEVPAGCEESVA